MAEHFTTGNINYVYGTDVVKIAPDRSVLLHSCNIEDGWGLGIAAQLARTFPKAQRVYDNHRTCVPSSRRLGTCLLIPPCETTAYPKDKQLWIGCLFCKARGGPVRAPQLSEFLTYFKTALADFRCQYQYHIGNHTASHSIGDVYCPLLNAGLFGVPWRVSATVMRDVGIAFNIVVSRSSGTKAELRTETCAVERYGFPGQIGHEQLTPFNFNSSSDVPLPSKRRSLQTRFSFDPSLTRTTARKAYQSPDNKAGLYASNSIEMTGPPFTTGATISSLASLDKDRGAVDRQSGQSQQGTPSLSSPVEIKRSASEAKKVVFESSAVASSAMSVPDRVAGDDESKGDSTGNSNNTGVVEIRQGSRQHPIVVCQGEEEKKERDIEAGEGRIQERGPGKGTVPIPIKHLPAPPPSVLLKSASLRLNLKSTEQKPTSEPIPAPVATPLPGHFAPFMEHQQQQTPDSQQSPKRRRTLQDILHQSRESARAKCW